ncbi:sulfurtransferase [Sorangium sp. So ce302]|uniref:sulfurtransferase n=1 Tax=Sorangium sp. So ce302 TaxID=3133297 RepID=UPI003F63C310
MKSAPRRATLIAAALALPGCVNRAEAVETREPQPEASLLRSPAWVAAHLDDPSVVVIHVDRDRRTYDREHISGARFLSVDVLAIERDVPNELPPLADVKAAFERAGVFDGSQVVLYGGMDGLAPARAFFALDVIGHGHRTALLDGSLGAWRAEGYPISSEAAEPRLGTLTSKPQPERVVDAEWVDAHLDDPGVVLVDARPPDEFRGDAGNGDVARRGHIPTAQNLFWRDFFVDRDARRMRPAGELRAMFERVGARDDRTVVVYCRTGMQSSFAYFVSRHLGYPTKMYDGSYVDWSRREHLPVERGPARRARDT